MELNKENIFIESGGVGYITFRFKELQNNYGHIIASIRTDKGYIGENAGKQIIRVNTKPLLLANGVGQVRYTFEIPLNECRITDFSKYFYREKIYLLWVDRDYLMDYNFKTLGDTGKLHKKYDKKFL